VLSLGATLYHPAKTAAVVSDNLNFQARLETSNGAIANDGNYNIEFNIYNASSGGTSLWTEDYLNSNTQGVRVVNGYVTVNLGSITAFPGTIAWDQDLYITMNIGGTSGGSPTWDGEMNPRLQLTSVPYAFQAKNATQLRDSNGANIATLGFTAPTANRTVTLRDASGTICLESSALCGFAPTTGGTGYIQNGTSLQTNANFYVQTSSTSAITGLIRAIGSQTADLLRFADSSGVPLSGFNASGQLYNQSGSFTGTLVQDTIGQNTAYHLLDPGLGTVDICLSTGNCAGSGGGATTAGGTQNYITKYTNAGGTQIGNSLFYDNGTFVGLNTTTDNGELSILSGGAAHSGLFVQSAASATTPTAVIKGGATPAGGGDLLQLQNSSGTVMVQVGATGSTLFKNSSNSTTDFRIQNSAGDNLFVVDSTNARAAVGQSSVAANSVLTVGTDTSGASGGIYLGTDTNIYRNDYSTINLTPNPSFETNLTGWDQYWSSAMTRVAGGVFLVVGVRKL